MNLRTARTLRAGDRAAVGGLALLAVASTVAAQTLPTRSAARPATSTLRLSFKLIAEIALPGPLPTGETRLVGDRIEVPVAGGVVLSGWEADSQIEWVAREAADAAPEASTDPASDAEAWSEDSTGGIRSRALASGRLVTQKRCPSCRSGWRRLWRLRIPGDRVAPPLLTDRRVYFGAQDNRVYSLRKKNGHRIWVADLGQRISRRLVMWHRPPEAAADEANGEPSANGVAKPTRDETAPPADALLVLPDTGQQLIALDPSSGAELARFELGEGAGRLRGLPLPTPDGKIVVAREKYNTTDASLLVLELTPAAATSPMTVPATPTEKSGPEAPSPIEALGSEKERERKQ